MEFDSKVLAWLGSDEKGMGYYFYFLTLRYSISPEALSRLRSVAYQLGREPDYWEQVISGSGFGWRTQLVGSYALLISNNYGYSLALMNGLRRFSFVSPQIAVILGILHPSEALSFFEEMILSPNTKDDPDRTTAMYQILLKLGSTVATSFDLESFKSTPPSDYSESNWKRNCEF